MKTKNTYIKEATTTVCTNIPDTDADKTGTDFDSDKTEKRKEPSKFDKPEKETDPDKTGIDTDSDSTKRK